MRSLRLIILTTFVVLLTSMSVYAAVTLESFTGVWQADEVTLAFETGSEIDHAAFHVWRSTTNIIPGEVNSSNATRLTENPIIGQNACNAGQGTYTYVDDTVEVDEDVYYYYLESLPCTSGDTVFFGALDSKDSGLAVTNPGTPENITLYLPLIQVLNPEP
jgi:hypothetical protein